MAVKKNTKSEQLAKGLTKLGNKPTTQPSKKLETFNRPPGPPAVVRFECPEFTCLCPKTGQPDFAYITIWYLPGEKCVELKALKLYLWSFREEGHFHEAMTKMIAGDIAKAIKPKWLMVEGNFWVRGGVHTVVWAKVGAVPRELETARQASVEYKGH